MYDRQSIYLFVHIALCVILFHLFMEHIFLSYSVLLPMNTQKCYPLDPSVEREYVMNTKT